VGNRTHTQLRVAVFMSQPRAPRCSFVHGPVSRSAGVCGLHDIGATCPPILSPQARHYARPKCQEPKITNVADVLQQAHWLVGFMNVGRFKTRTSLLPPFSAWAHRKCNPTERGGAMSPIQSEFSAVWDIEPPPPIARPVHPPNYQYESSNLKHSSAIRPSTARASRQVGRGDGDRVFRAAARHSLLVRFLRFAIPAGIASIAVIIVVATFLNPFRLIANFPIDPGEISLSGSKDHHGIAATQWLHYGLSALRPYGAHCGPGPRQA
jgi:hypothetical protein